MTDNRAKEILNKEAIDISKVRINELVEYLYWEFDELRNKNHLGERDCFKNTIIPVLNKIAKFDDGILVNIPDSITEFNKQYVAECTCRQIVTWGAPIFEYRKDCKVHGCK